MRYSPSTGGFYPESIGYASVPADVVTLSDSAYRELLTGQSTGKRIVAGAGGVPELADSVPETPAPVRAISFSQLLIGLVSEGWITQSEGENWLVGTLPAPVLGLIATLPAGQQFAARARATRPSVVLRDDTLVLALGAAQGKSAGQLDAFFNTYGVV